MDLTVTVARSSTGVRTDARLCATDTDPAGPLLDDLRQLVGAPGDEPVYADGRRLDPAGTTGRLELCDGQLLTIGGVPDGCAGGGDTSRGPLSLPWVLAVVAGPGVGSRVTLTTGRATVGRDPACDLTLDHPAISRCHLAVTLDGSGVFVEDLGSSNGTAVEGRSLAPHRPVRLEPGSGVRLGDCELAVDRARPQARLVPAAGGLLTIHRSPRPRIDARPVEIRLPTPPAAPTPTRLPVLAAAAPLVVGVLLAVLLHQWQLLAFTVLSPVMIAGQAASDRLSSRRTHRLALAAHARELATAPERRHHGTRRRAGTTTRRRAGPGQGRRRSARAHRRAVATRP
jgi:S-DNA-T family DNA segregation ATPase FtsK/SpoIIIE